MSTRHQLYLAVFLASSFLAVSAWAYPTFPDCADLTNADFRVEKLVGITTNDNTIKLPIYFALDDDGAGGVDVYYTEHAGIVKRFDASEGTVSTIGTIPVQYGRFIDGSSVNGEHGLIGIALDPDFDNNGWIYLYGSLDDNFRIGRYTFRGGQLDMASRSVILDIPMKRDGWHTGGAMEFDAYGDMWISVGENGSDVLSSGCTADLRGSILRIHPLPVSEGITDFGVGKTYSIPQGNFGEFFGNKYEAGGDNARAADFRNTSLVYPEIFAKGQRNPYTLAVDPVRQWVTWGDCGPDMGQQQEESNVAPEPGFFGYPWWAGNQLPVYGRSNSIDRPRPEGACQGIDMPPSIPGTYSYQQACAMGGPIYLYDHNLVSDVKLPPHFNRKWFILDLNHDWVKLGTLSDDGKTLLNVDNNIFTDPALRLYDPLASKIGPDGALYVNNFGNYGAGVQNTSIVRIEYVGPVCDAVGIEPFPVIKPRRSELLTLSSRQLSILPQGDYSLAFYDYGGRPAGSFSGSGPHTYILREMLKPGLYILQARIAGSRVVEKMTVY